MYSAQGFNHKNIAMFRTGVSIIVIHWLEFLQCIFVLKFMLLSETNRRLPDMLESMICKDSSTKVPERPKRFQKAVLRTREGGNFTPEFSFLLCLVSQK